MSFSKVAGVVGDQTEFEFALTTLNMIPSGGYLTLEFEDNSLQTGSQMEYEDQDGNSFAL